MSQNHVVLPNGLVLTDNAPGNTRRNSPLRPGAWKCARILLYSFMTFPRLWACDREGAQLEAESASFSYSWVDWVEKLEKLPKSNGSWRELAKALDNMGPNLSIKLVEDIVKAITELVLRDAETERFSYRHSRVVQANSHTYTPVSIPNESQLLTRARTAAQYIPRTMRLQRYIYEAIAAYNAPRLHQIAESAPQSCVIHSVAQRHSLC